MPKMVEVVIDSVRVSLTNQQRIVVLREVNAERYLPIWIGPYEAEAITIALQEIEVARPQTHDLLKNVLLALNARLLRVEVISLREDVFYGNLILEMDNKIINIDSRPSDALALAARTRVPILVSKEVMDSAGVEPEHDIRNDPVTEASPEMGVEENVDENDSEERLSVFEDFLQNLDLDAGDDSLTSSEGDDEEEPEG